MALHDLTLAARQFLRYGIVGLTSNGILYLVYLGLPAGGVGHKTAMTILYTCGTVGTFFLNRSWTFGHGGPMRRSLWRYAAVYAFGYVENLAALYVLVDLAGLPHQIVQAILIFAVAVTIFLLQRFWVFPYSAAGGADVRPGLRTRGAAN